MNTLIPMVLSFCVLLHCNMFSANDLLDLKDHKGKHCGTKLISEIFKKVCVTSQRKEQTKDIQSKFEFH